VFLLIKGNDLHTGISPSVDPSKREKFFEDLDALGMHVGPENRIVYVSYPNRPACTREAQLSLTRPLTFGNHGAPVAYKLKHLNFADHGRHILGDARSYYNRMAREAVYMYWNFCQYTGLISEDPFEMIKKMTYTDEAEETCHCEPPQYHPIRDAEEIAQLRGRYQWHKQTAAMHRIVVLKKDLLFRQKALTGVSKSTTARKKNLHFQLQRRFPVKFNIAQPAADSSSAPPVLDQENHIDTLSNVPANINISSPHQSSSATSLAPVLIDAANTFLPIYSITENIPSTAPAPNASLPHMLGSPPITETDGHDSLTTNFISASSDQVDHSSAGSDVTPHRRSARISQNIWADYHTSTISSEICQTSAIDRRHPATSNRRSVHHNRTTDPQPTRSYPTLGKRKRANVETTDGDNPEFVPSSSGANVALANNAAATKRIRVDSPNKQLIADNEVPNQSTRTSDPDVSPVTPIPHVDDIANTSAPLDPTPDPNLRNNCAMLVDTSVGMGGSQSTVTDVSMEHELLSADVEMIDTIANQLGNDGSTHNNQVGGGGSDDGDDDDYFDEDDDNDSDYRDGLAENEYEVEVILNSRVNVSLFAFPLFVCLRYPKFQAKGRMEFYVKWKDYSSDHNSWLSKTALRSVYIVIRHAFSSD
jgi:hypothetical protein